jgi:hypothetical protein
MRIVQIVPREEMRLYGALVKKEAAIAATGRGAFYRAGPKTKNSAKWKHTKHKGWVKLERGLSEVVTAAVRSLNADQEWQILDAFLGFVYRHFGKEVMSIIIHSR